jgi:hypothetical protein
MKLLIAAALGLAAASTFAQTAGDSLSGALHPPGKTIARNFDPSRPTYLRIGALVCQSWQLMRGAAEDAAKVSGAERQSVLERYKCTQAPTRMEVGVLIPERHSLTEAAEATYGYVGIRWRRSDGTFDFGFVGPTALEN